MRLNNVCYEKKENLISSVKAVLLEKMTRSLISVATCKSKCTYHQKTFKNLYSQME